MQRGRVITVASASGGCGKTFFATNLAWFLAHHGHRSVCVIDLDLRFGEVGTALRLRPDRTIADLIGHTGADADLGTRLAECCERHPMGIHVLAAPRDPEDIGAIGVAEVRSLISAAREQFDEVIVDTPPTLTDIVVEAIDQSDQVMVLATMDVPSLRNLKVLLATFERLQIPGERLRLVLNRTDHEAGVEAHELLATFPQLFATLPFSRAVERSTAAGRPVMVTAPTDEIAHRLHEVLRPLLPADARAELDEIDLREFGPRPRRWRRMPLRVT